MTLAFKLEQKVSVFIRKWLHLHHSTSSLCFYSSVSRCPLPIKSLSSALKASKISGHLLLRNSKDPLVSSCIPKLQTGTWKVEDAVLSCKNDIKISQVCGSDHQTGMGLDTPPHQKSLKTNLQNITGDIFQSTAKQSMTLRLLQSCPTAVSRPVDKMDELSSARLFLGFCNGNAS